MDVLRNSKDSLGCNIPYSSWLMLMKTLLHNLQKSVHSQSARRSWMLAINSDPVNDAENAIELKSNKSGSTTRRRK